MSFVQSERGYERQRELGVRGAMSPGGSRAEPLWGAGAKPLAGLSRQSLDWGAGAKPLAGLSRQSLMRVKGRALVGCRGKALPDS